MITCFFFVLSLATVAAMHLKPNPLGHLPEYTKQQSGKCLKFIHNPRTGGTSIDSMNLQLPQGQRAYDTIMQAYLDRAAGSKLFPSETPGHLFREAHGAEMADESAAAAHYGPYLQLFDFRYDSWMSRETGLQQTCQDL